MEFSHFLRQRREELGLSQAVVAERLSVRGQETSSARVGHWETKRNKPPLEKPAFRQALAAALEMSLNDMMSALGFVEVEDDRSNEAVVAANIIDSLPPDARQLALDYLQVLEKRFAQHS